MHIIWQCKYSIINPLVPDSHYRERQDKQASLHSQKLEVDRW